MRESHGAATSAAPGLQVEADPSTPEVDLVIVGGGPRAVATVARLAARLRPHAPFGGPAPSGDPAIRVAIIDAVQVGSGATWRTDQHPLLLNNTYSAQTTAHADDSTDQDGPLVPGPDLVQWAVACSDSPTQRYLGIGPERPAWLGAELAALRPESYPTRRLQGVYYRDQLAEAARRGGIEVWHIEGTATDIEATGLEGAGPEATGLAPAGTEAATGGHAYDASDHSGARAVGTRRLVRLTGAHRVAIDGPHGHRAHHPEPVSAISAPLVILAQGMIQAEPSAQTRTRTDRARQQRLLYVPPGMPSERDWTQVPGDGQDVLVAGMGANFFDVIGILTAGRGGRFTLADTGAQVDAAGFAAVDGGAGGPAAGAPLHYAPSGAEPRLLVGSRRGLPYRGKGAYPTGMPPPWQPRIATAEAIANACRGGVQNLRTQVWPLLAAEFAAAHLITLTTHHRHAVADGVDEPAIIAALTRGADPTAVVADLVTAPGYALDVDRLDRPAAVAGTQEWEDWVRTWLDQEQDSIANPLTSPRNAVNRAMATLRVLLGRHVAAGALDGRARLVEYEDWFAPLGLTLASGPPPRRTAQLLALVRAGVVQLLGEGLAIEADDDGFRARTRVHPGGVVARALLETRMSRGQVPGTSDPLLSTLMGSGRARLHRVPDATGTGGWAETTTMDVTPGEFALIDAAGRVDQNVLVLGIPAETVQPGSAIGATPGLPSPLLAGADRVAAQALARIAVPV